MEGNLIQNGACAVVTETHILKINIAFDWRERNGALRGTGLRWLAENFMGTLEAGKGFGQLRTDLYDLHHRRDQKSHKTGVREKFAVSHRTPLNLPGPSHTNNRP